MGVCEGRWRSEEWRDRTNNTSYYHNSINMGRIILCSTILLCLIVPVPAPFAKDDPRSIFNFLIEPWWCLVPKIVRELLHIKYFGAPLNEVGPCTTQPKASAGEPQPEGEPQAEGEPQPEGEPEPEGGSYAEPEPRITAEPESEPRNGRENTEDYSESGKLDSQTQPEPEPEPRVTRDSEKPELSL